MHCASESHTRKALEAGQNFKSVQDDFSKQFLNEFMSHLKTAHGEKEVHINKFYQEVIARRDHVHLNATRWHSLTEFAKHIGREGLCRVEQKDDGIFIAWIDDSPEAIKRRDAVRRKEMMEKGEEEREQMLIRSQIQRARKDAEARGIVLNEAEAEAQARGELRRQEGEKIKLSFGGLGKKAATTEETTSPSSLTKSESPAAATGADAAGQVKEDGVSSSSPDGRAEAAPEPDGQKKEEASDKAATAPKQQPATADVAPKPVSMKFGLAKPQPKNVFKNAFAGVPKKKVVATEPKKMSEAERIMNEELERKRSRESGGGGGGNSHKRPRF